MSWKASIPAHWSVATLKDVAEIQGGIQKQPKRAPMANAYPYLRVANVLRGQLDLSEVHEIELFGGELERLCLQMDDLLIVEGNGSPAHIGRMAVWRGAIRNCVHQNHIIRARLASGVLPKFAEAFWNSPAGSTQVLGVASSTSGLYTLSVSKVGAIKLPIPPLNEQRAISEEIEKQFTRIDAGVAALKRVQANLKRYRASVLKAACKGRLVPTEAELARREGRDYEPASVLLQRILKERRRRWEEAELAKLKANGKAPKDDRWKTKYKEPEAPETSGLPELPEGWCWATVEQISTLVTDGDHNPPARAADGVPHLTAKNVRGGKLSVAGCSYLNVEGFAKTRARYEPRESDVIVTCVGTVGEVAIVPRNFVFSADRNLAGIRLVAGGVTPDFLEAVLCTPGAQFVLRNVSGSTAQPHLYLGDLRGLPVPIAPLLEQGRVVSEVQRILSITRESESAVRVDHGRAERLRQSILKAAFEGKLVQGYAAESVRRTGVSARPVPTTDRPAAE